MKKPSAFPVLAVVAILGLGGYDFYLSQQISKVSTRVDNGVEATDVAALTAQLAGLDASLKELQAQAPGYVSQSDFNAALKATGSRLEAIELKNSQATNSAVDQSELVAFSARLESAEAQIKNLHRPQQPNTAAQASTKPHRVIAKPVVLTPPFQVIGIESRGSERFLSVAPFGSTRLDEVLLIRPGDAQQAWKLEELTEQSALFSVNGTQQTVRLK